MELWDLYDIHRMPLHATHSRNVPLASGTYHTVVHCCVFDTQGNMLIQQRQPFKEGWANMWDITVGGSALAGESSQQAIGRELFEELSISYDFTNIRPNMTINFSVGFDDMYIIEHCVDIDKLVLQHSEVQSVAWASLDDIMQAIDNGTFIPYQKSLIQLLFQSRHSYGAIAQQYD